MAGYAWEGAYDSQGGAYDSVEYDLRRVPEEGLALYSQIKIQIDMYRE